ncbi:hypothetical protein Acy02nite_63260 [Actinoplanes cyaneus]|uniref:Uncharacterized protein n=1 Tax=Actinoplanes cyaneus TaxID=52696 RepID=A0A919ILV4_9ACTN|nr:Atu4866 domain-containing protein [Actinoplanes cyaneus]MCW2141950.1 protein Atu4866 [Actinoplanes cyaneus]GID68445.1 hypothetical protein Acy02nite_63260 [Actinoplanes cyaneus]
MHSSPPRVDTTILDAAAMLAIALGRTTDDGLGVAPQRPRVITGAAVVGAWRSSDGMIKLRIRTDGTYAGEVAGRRSRPHGTYRIDGDAVVLHDDASGLSTQLTLVHDGELEMAGHRLLPE